MTYLWPKRHIWHRLGPFWSSQHNPTFPILLWGRYNLNKVVSINKAWLKNKKDIPMAQTTFPSTQWARSEVRQPAPWQPLGLAEIIYKKASKTRHDELKGHTLSRTGEKRFKFQWVISKSRSDYVTQNFLVAQILLMTDSDLDMEY